MKQQKIAWAQRCSRNRGRILGRFELPLHPCPVVWGRTSSPLWKLPTCETWHHFCCYVSVKWWLYPVKKMETPQHICLWNAHSCRQRAEHHTVNTLQMLKIKHGNTFFVILLLFWFPSVQVDSYISSLLVAFLLYFCVTCLFLQYCLISSVSPQCSPNTYLPCVFLYFFLSPQRPYLVSPGLKYKRLF